MSVVSQRSGRNSYTGMAGAAVRRSAPGLRRRPRAVAQPADFESRFQARRKTTAPPRPSYEEPDDVWSDTSSSDGESRQRRRRRRPRCGKDWYDWNKCLPPSCYPSTYTPFPIMGYGYNCAIGGYFGGYYGGFNNGGFYDGGGAVCYPAPRPTLTTAAETVCGPQGCTTFTQPQLTTCNPYTGGCMTVYGPPNIASISDTVFKRNLY